MNNSISITTGLQTPATARATLEASPADGSFELEDLDRKIALLERFQRAPEQERRAIAPFIYKIVKECSPAISSQQEVPAKLLQHVLSSLRQRRDTISFQEKLTIQIDQEAKEIVTSLPVSLFELPQDMLAQIALHADEETYKALLVTSPKFAKALSTSQSFNPTLKAAIGMVGRHPDFYHHFSPTLQMDSSVLTTHILSNPNKIFEVHQSIIIDDQYQSLLNLLKRIAYLKAKLNHNADICKKLEQDEPGSTKIIPELVSSILSIGWPIEWDKLTQNSLIPHIAQALIFVFPRRAPIITSLFSNNQEIVLAAVSQTDEALRFASDELQQDRDVMLAAVKHNGLMLGNASAALKNDKEVVLAAVTQNSKALRFASDELQQNKEIMLAAVKQQSNVLKHNVLTLDNEFMVAAVKQNGMALEFASAALKNDKKVVLAAVIQNGMALRFASDALQNNEEVVLAAIKQNGMALKFASNALQNNRELVLEAIKQNGAYLFYAYAFKNNKEVVLAAVTQNGMALRFASDVLQDNKEVVLATVTQNGMALEFASATLKKNEEVVLAAVTQNGLAFQFASDELKNDKETVLAVVTKNDLAFEFASVALQNDKDVVLAAIKQNGYLLGHVSPTLQNDKEVVLAAVTQNGDVLRFASDELQHDEEVILAAKKQKLFLI